MKFKPYSRRKHNELLRTWAGTHKRLVVSVLIGLCVIVAIETVTITVAFEAEPWRWYLLGAVHAGAVAACVGLLWSAFHVHEGGAMNQLRGAWGEEFTRDELARAKRRRLIWDWVDSITVETGDIDHLVVTRNGGLVAIDTKFRSAERLHDVDELRDSASRVRTRAQGFVAGYLRAESGQHRSRGPAHRVTPLVVVWGKAQHSIPEAAAIDDVAFVGGRQLVDWLRRLEGEPIDRRAAQHLVRELGARRLAAWEKRVARQKLH